MALDTGNTTYYLPGAPRDECSLPLMPTGPGFPSDYQQSNPGIAAKMSFIDSSIDFAPRSSGRCPASLGGVSAFRAVRSLFLQVSSVSSTLRSCGLQRL